jgi:hypothetical protein
MKKQTPNRTIVIITGVIAILALTLVTSALKSLQFKEAEPFSLVVKGFEETFNIGKLYMSMQVMVVIAIAMLFILTLLALIVMPAKQRRRFVAAMGVILLLLAIVMVLINMGDHAPVIPEPQDLTPVAELGEEDEGQTPMPTVIPSEFIEPQIDPWIAYVVALGICMIAGLAAWLLLIRRKRSKMPSLESIAQDAIDDLQAGKDWGETVEDAYLRMVETVHKRRGLNRRSDITPAEFAVILVKIGLPAQPVRRLTALFERVRYGGRSSTREDVEEAVDCLTEIMSACQEIDA